MQISSILILYNQNKAMRNLQYLFSTCMFLITTSTMFAQIPTEVPHPDNNSPIDLTKTADILIYIVLPIIIIILLVLRARNKNK